MTSPVPLVFWTILALGPIPIWHLLLHAGLPFWKRHPRAFYGAAAAVWALFLPLSQHLAARSSPLFVATGGVKLLCLGTGIVSFLVALWSIKTLTPSRFFLWAVLRPREHPPVLIRRGPYRFTAHPTYVAMIVAVASSFLASGEVVLLGACGAMALLLTLVATLEQQELRARLSGSFASSPDRAPAAAALAPLAMGTDEGE